MKWENTNSLYSSGLRLMIGKIKVASVYSNMCGRVRGEILLPGFKKEFTGGTFDSPPEAQAFCEQRVKRWFEIIDKERAE